MMRPYGPKSLKYVLFGPLLKRFAYIKAMASVVSLQRQDAGSIPGPAQWVKGLALLQVGHNCSSDLIPGQETLYAAGWPKGKEKEREK